MSDCRDKHAKDYVASLNYEIDANVTGCFKFVLYHIITGLIVCGTWKLMCFFGNMQVAWRLMLSVTLLLGFIVEIGFFGLFFGICVFVFFFEYSKLIKLPLMKLSCKKVKVFKNNMPNFQIGIIDISKLGRNSEGYYNVKDFVGYVLNNSVAFKPTFWGFIKLYCCNMFDELMDFFDSHLLKPFLGEAETRRNKRAKTSINTEISIMALTREIDKMREQSEGYLNQAKDEMQKVGKQ